MPCGSGWIVSFDLRTGRFDKKFAHKDCVNAVAVRGPYLVSAGDDKLVRVTDLRRDAFAPLSAQRAESTVFSVGLDHDTVYAGSDNGDLLTFDYSAASNPRTEENAGGFNSQQKEALAAAIEASSRRLPRGT
jgi:WD40 repeat protein